MDAQEDEPGSLWPPSQAVHSSVAPDENVFSRQATEADRSVLGTLPGSALLQKPARIALNSPALSQGLQKPDPRGLTKPVSQGSQPSRSDAPVVENLPAGHWTSDLVALSQ